MVLKDILMFKNPTENTLNIFAIEKIIFAGINIQNTKKNRIDVPQAIENVKNRGI